MKKTPLTKEEHEALAIVLQRMREALLTMTVRIGNANPMKSRAYRSVDKARRALDELRSALDDDQYRTIGNTVRYYRGGSPVEPLLSKSFGRPEGR